MDLRDKIKTKLREAYGSFHSHLEFEYEKHVTENLFLGDINSKSEWITYNQVILEFKHNLKDMLKVKELQYRLTEEINPNEVCIDVISRVENRTPELERLYNKIINF